MERSPTGLRARLKGYPLLVRIKRAAWRVYFEKGPYQIWRLVTVQWPYRVWRWFAPDSEWKSLCLKDKHHFRRHYRQKDNLGSVAFEEGLVTGFIADRRYLLKIRGQGHIQSHVYISGQWEPHVVNLMSSYLKDEGGVVIDIGANAGAISIPLAVCHPTTTFHLFEPHPGVVADLRDNVACNLLGNVVIHDVAITEDVSRTLPFNAQRGSANMGLSGFGSNFDMGEVDVIDVKCARIDDIFANAEGRIRIMKIDTQGTELSVLMASRETISKHRPIVIFEFETEYFRSEADESLAKQGILDFFATHAYELYSLQQGSAFAPRVNLKGYYNGDILAVPRAI